MLRIDSFTPFYSMWCNIFRLRADMPLSVQARKVRGRLTHIVAGLNPAANGKGGATGRRTLRPRLSLPPPPPSHCSGCSVGAWRRWPCSCCCIMGACWNGWHAREWSPEPEQGLLPIPRLRPATHVLCVGPGGRQRCVKCLRLAASLPGAPCLGTRQRPRDVFTLGPGIFCRRCGSYSFTRTVHLCATCKGQPSGPVVIYRLAKMLSGRHPVSGAWIAAPAPLGNPAGALYLLL